MSRIPSQHCDWSLPPRYLLALNGARAAAGKQSSC
jgi:hypothetical protein